jgi:hypothetical protein
MCLLCFSQDTQNPSCIAARVAAVRDEQGVRYRFSHGVDGWVEIEPGLLDVTKEPYSIKIAHTTDSRHFPSRTSLL